MTTIDELPDIRILFGKQGIMNAYEECLTNNHLDIKCVSAGYSKILGSWFDDIYAPKLYSAVKTRELLPDTPKNRQSTKSKKPNSNETRFITITEPIESDLVISESTVTVISFNIANPFALIIKDSETVKSLKQDYAILWKNARY